MSLFYTKISTRAYHGPNTQNEFTMLPKGMGREIIDEVDGWLVYKEGNILRFVRAEEVLYKSQPDVPIEIREQLAALLAWARGLGFKS